MTLIVSLWVWDQNVQWAMQQLASLVQYAYDKLDADAVDTGIADTDADTQRWFDYPLVGTPVLSVSLARNDGASPVDIRVSGDLDEVLAARIETVLNVLSTRPPQ